MNIVEYILGIKSESDRLIIALNNSKINLEIYYPNIQKLMSYDDGENGEVLVLDTKAIHISIPESEIDAEGTYNLNQATLRDQDNKAKEEVPDF